MENFKGGIYLITNKINGKKYVGSTHDFISRWRGHKSMLNRGVHFNNHLQNSWNKYGENNFEFSVLEALDESIDNFEQYLIEREEFNIQNLDCINCGYNTRTECNTNKGLKWSEESKKNFSEYRKSHIVQEAVEALNKYSESRKGIKNQAASDWYNSLSDEEKSIHNQKCLEGRIKAAEERGYWHSQETIDKIINTKKEKGLINTISLYNLDGSIFKIYESYSDCLRDFNESTKNSSVLTNNIKSGKLFHGFIVSKETSDFLPDYLNIVKLINKCKSNLRYYKYDKSGELIDIFINQNQAAKDCGLVKASKEFTNAIKNGTIYRNYYWKCVEPINSDVYSKVGEFSESPEVDNTEPSQPLTKLEGATTNS